MEQLLTETMIRRFLSDSMAKTEPAEQIRLLAGADPKEEAQFWEDYGKTLRRFQLCLEALPDRERAAIRETYGTGDKLAAAAARLGICRNTLGKYRSRGKKHLEELFRSEYTEAQLRKMGIQSFFGMERKRMDYMLLTQQLKALTEEEPLCLPNLCNAAALLYQSLEQVNWAGFYLVHDKQLVLGPFQGKTACIRIDFGKGVCGTAWERDETVVVEDVHAFPGHIACDSASASEIVIPLHKDGTVIGVLDIDSPVKGRFTKEDRAGLEHFSGEIEHILETAGGMQS